MSHLKTVFILLLPLRVAAQDLTGIWTGFLEFGDNKLPYELVISGEKDKFSGYSLMTFTFNGVENVGVKTMEIKVKRGSIAIEDGDLIYDNYNTPPKKVKLYGSLAWVGRDTNMTLAGTFATRAIDMRASMNENSFKGIIHLQKRNLATHTKLTSKLGEMDLFNRLTFTQPAIKKKEQATVSSDVKQKDAGKSSKIKVEKTTPEKKTEPDLTTQPNQKQPVKPVGPIPSAADVTKRNTEVIQTVSFRSDSLKISLYDNGEVDGDTVTIVLNNKVIIAKQGLTTKAATTTIYTGDLGDSVQLIMYAENLGRIPPNTGLLILQDGNDRYQVRFSGDLQNNSAIILKRKR